MFTMNTLKELGLTVTTLKQFNKLDKNRKNKIRFFHKIRNNKPTIKTYEIDTDYGYCKKYNVYHIKDIEGFLGDNLTLKPNTLICYYN